MNFFKRKINILWTWWYKQMKERNTCLWRRHKNKCMIMKNKIKIPAWMDSTRRGYFRDQREFDDFLPEQNVSWLILWFVPIDTPDNFVQNLFPYMFWTLFGRFFLSWWLYLDVSCTYIHDRIHLNLIIKSLK